MAISEVELYTDQEKLRRAVRDRYASLAQGNCCEVSSSNQISDAELSGLPDEAIEVNASCGSPLKLIAPRVGETVLDLGSGGGIDVFRASKLVGESGKAIGVDSTPEMIWRARGTAKQHGYSNVEFRLGEIESLPMGSDSVDYVISNCVINLSPDKQRVFNEAYRVLKAGGTFAVADMTSESEIPLAAKENLESWCSCEGGAITRSRYQEQLRQAGFKDIEIRVMSGQNTVDSACCEIDGTGRRYGIESTHIIARK